MPRYNYKCNECASTLEVTRSIHEPDTVQECYWCEHGIYKRMYIPAAVQFKGSGFYSTDNA